jgi:hypothetical protein
MDEAERNKAVEKHNKREKVQESQIVMRRICLAVNAYCGLMLAEGMIDCGQ